MENYCADSEAEHHEADVLSVEPSDWVPDPYVAYKPVVYLYPEAETDVCVNLELDGALHISEIQKWVARESFPERSADR